MTLADAWNAYMSLLHDRAPATAASIRPPRAIADRTAAEAATTPWTAELREFFALHDGQNDSNGPDDYVGTVFPDLTLMSLEEVLYKHKLCRENLHPIDDLGDDWPEVVRTQSAGETAEMFLDFYVPFAEDGAGDFFYVDTRPGDLQGCVRYFAAEAADQGQAAYDSLTDYLTAVRVAVEKGSDLYGLVPTVRDGALIWEFQLPERHDPVPNLVNAVLNLPFTPIDFLPSQVSDADDLIDLNVVKRKVMDTARSMHPGAIVDDAQTVYQRVPRQRGANMNWWVRINGAEAVYTTFVTGDADEVIVVETPLGGYEIMIGEQQ
ncbi:SMI1/KNR4 family protein [Rhodococcus sp. I2R]|uniref:SMI1/KNR4 family protein n=1 Tax=Rhodococcus sp. I2R TaxID=2855445 RepID=UPI001E62115D|nr:SMI1/KNR4 family protein [Rhodococcus sp. I2R]MCC8928819.1 SMI1/KNR4 family protein [Rhodococcus sp. I2R]